MDEKNVKKVIELDANIGIATAEIQAMNGVPFDTGYFTIGYNRITADENLLKQIIRLAVNYKREKITEWQKELDEL